MMHLAIFFALAHIQCMEPREIIELRQALKLSRAAFGKALGVDRSTIHRWEAGETVPPGILLDLACKQLEHAQRDRETSI